MSGGYCTNWDAFNTPRLWSMVMNEQDPIAREQVQGWQRLAGSIRSQHQALTRARADLVAAWPPEQNASAEAFVNELDRLMKRLEAAATDADTTAGGLDKILNALDTAKKAIEPLWEKYKDKSDDLLPRWFDGAEDEIDDQARNHMITMENAVSDAVAELKVPDIYNFSIGEGGDEWPPPTGPGSGSGRLSSGGVSPAVPHNPPPPLPGQEPILPDTPGGPGAGGPGFETPDPDAPGDPNAPGGPGGPNAPGGPGGPNAPGSSGGPGDPNAPGAPGRPGDPNAPGGPGAGLGGGGGAVTRPGGPDLAGVINPPPTPPPLGSPGGGPTAGGPVPVGPVAGGGPIAGGGGPLPVSGVPPLVPGLLPGGGPVAGGGGAGRPPAGAAGRGPNAGRPLPSGAVIGGPGSIGGPGAISGPGAAGGRGIGGAGSGGGRGVGGGGAGSGGSRGVGSRPGAGSIGGADGEPGRGGGTGRGPGLSGVGGPGTAGGRGLGGVRGPGTARGRSGRRDGDETSGIRPGAGDVEAFGSAPAGSTIGGPIGGTGAFGAGSGRAGAGSGRAGGAGAGNVGGGRAAAGDGAGQRGARAPRPAWLPDDPVGPDRHTTSATPGGRGSARSRSGDDPTGFDPDNPWQVAEGVTPVINPDVNTDRHDPGPNVIGRRG